MTKNVTELKELIIAEKQREAALYGAPGKHGAIPTTEEKAERNKVYPVAAFLEKDPTDSEALENLRISIFDGPVSNVSRQDVAGWQEFCRRLRDDLVVLPDNKSATKARFGQYFVRGRINGERNDDNLTDCCLVVLDVDKSLPGEELPPVYEIHDTLGDIIHAVYTSVTPGRSRIVVPVASYQKEDTATLTLQLYNFCRSLGLDFAYATESKTASQPWFYGQTLDRDNFVCLINNDGDLFTGDPDFIKEALTQTATIDPKPNTSSNHLADFIGALKNGTIHEAVKVHVEWLNRTTNLTIRQIFDDVTVLIEEHCSDRDKVARWHESERAGLETWFRGNVCVSESEPVLMTAEECQTQSNFSLEIPAAVADPGGLISLGMEALSQPGMAAIQQYNLPVILTTIANAIGGKLVFRGVHPNLFNVKIGPTSTGKSEGDKRIKLAIHGAGLSGFYGPSDFASGPALLRALADNPRCIVVIDEGTPLFRRSGKADTVSDGKRDALLELFSASGQEIQKAYSDKRNNITIENPCLSLTANATTDIFQSIEHKDFLTGLMQRFDFWCYDGLTPKRGRAIDGANEALLSFVDGLKLIAESTPASGNLATYTGVPLSLRIDRTADDRLQDWSNTTVDRVNSAEDDGERGIISRAYDLSIKYAMVHLAATRQATELTDPLMIEDIEYGILVAWMLAEWKMTRLRNRISYGDFDRDCELLKDAIRRALSIGRRPTMAVLVNRCRPLRNLPGYYLEQIIKTLTARGEIFTDTKNATDAYNLVRQ